MLSSCVSYKACSIFFNLLQKHTRDEKQCKTHTAKAKKVIRYYELLAIINSIIENRARLVVEETIKHMPGNQQVNKQKEIINVFIKNNINKCML